MIIKPYEARVVRDQRLKAGVRAEKQMAHYLDRHFKDSDRFFVLHDLRVEFEGDVAQIDHLVVHRYGVAIVESKAVSTAVRINPAGEWTRQVSGKWTGMPDPLLQGMRQGQLLKRLLESKDTELLDKLLLGTVQGTFTFMAIDVYAAISDEGRIERATEDQAPNVRKADAVPLAVEQGVARHRRDANLLGGNLVAFTRAPRDFNKSESLRIARFLHAMSRPASPQPVDAPGVSDHLGPPKPLRSRAEPMRTVTAACKACGSRDLDAKIGKYGPYGRCRACGKNTKIQEACQGCGAKVYLNRDGIGFAGSCDHCRLPVQVVLGPVST